MWWAALAQIGGQLLSPAEQKPNYGPVALIGGGAALGVAAFVKMDKTTQMVLVVAGVAIAGFGVYSVLKPPEKKSGLSSLTDISSLVGQVKGLWS